MSQAKKKAGLVPSSLNISICPTSTPPRHGREPFHKVQPAAGMDSHTEHYSHSKQDCAAQYLFCNLWRLERPL